MRARLWPCNYKAVLVAAFINPGGDAIPVRSVSPPFFLECQMKSGRSLVDLAKELERQVGTKIDMVVPSSLMSYRTDDRGVSVVDIEEASGGRDYGISDLARRQLAEKLKIPYAYFERMRSS